MKIQHIHLNNRYADTKVQLKSRNQRGVNLFLLPLPFLVEPAARAIMSPPTDWISACFCRHNPLRFSIIIVALRKEWWDFIKHRFFTQICTHLCNNWSAVICQTRDLEFLNTQTGSCPNAAATPLHLSIRSNSIKRMVRNRCVLTILQFFHSPFFN